MTAYNAERFIAAAIESVLNQSFGDLELLVVDDRSEDRTGAIAASYAARDPRIRLIASDRKGRVPALNRTLEEARAPWFAVHDSDDVALPDKFERQMAFLAAHPEYGVIGSDNELIGPDDAPVVRPPVVRPLDHEAMTADMEAGILLLHSTMIARTDIMRAIGGYRAPFAYSEDYDIYLRLAVATRMANMPERLLRYRVYPEQVSTKHLVVQTYRAVVAWLSHRARLEGRPDPVAGLEELPPLGSLDALFGLVGTDRYVREKIVQRMIFCPATLAGDGFPLLLDHIAESGARGELWRAAARLLKAGHPHRAARLGFALAAA
jgi:hypothetical protein